MHTPLFQHLKRHHLLPEARSITRVTERVFKECLAADDEEIRIITDTG